MGNRHRTGGHERGRARRRCARGVVGVPRVAHGSQSRVFSRGAEAVFRHLGLAQRRHPGGQVHPREIAVDFGRARRPRVGAAHRRQPGDVDVVLDERRHAAEEAGASRCRRLGTSPVESLAGHAVQCRVDGFGAGDRCLDDLGRAYPTGVEGVDQTNGVEVTERVVTECVHMSHPADATAGRPRTGRTGSR